MLSCDDFPNYADVLQGLGKPLGRASVPFEGNVTEEVSAMFAEIEQQGGLPSVESLPGPTPPRPDDVAQYPEDEFHFLVASGLGYTLAGAKTTYAENWPGDWNQYSSNADRWAKAYLNARDYLFFTELVVKLTA